MYSFRWEWSVVCSVCMLMENETLSVEKLLVRAVQYTHLFHIIQCKYM